MSFNSDAHKDEFHPSQEQKSAALALLRIWTRNEGTSEIQAAEHHLVAYCIFATRNDLRGLLINSETISNPALSEKIGVSTR